MLKPTVAGIVLLFGLAACAATTSRQSINTGYTVEALRYAAGTGYLLTEIRGSPFAVPQAAFEHAVTDAMYGQHHGPDVPFVTVPPPDARSPYRVVMLFGPPGPVDANRLCIGNDGAAPAPPGGPVSVVAAFCEPDTALTAVHAHAGPAAGPDDPAFQSFIAQVTNQLFPPVSPNLGGSDWND